MGDLLDYVDQHEWINWVMLFLVPPLGIWMLWRRRRYPQSTNILLTTLSLLWMLAVIVVLFVRPFRARPDTTITPQPVGAAALPTEVPEPTEVPPEAEGVVVTAEEVDDANAVFIVDGTPWYHQSEGCQAIPGGVETNRIARNTAVERSLLACPYCLASQYSDGLWDLVFVTGATEDRSGMKVYCSAYNAFFHTKADCSDLGSDAQEVGLKEALLMGKTACETCCPDAGHEVFCTVDGTYYHVEEECSGMRNASKVPYAEARVLGKKRCPVCIGGTDEEEEAAEAEAARQRLLCLRHAQRHLLPREFHLLRHEGRPTGAAVRHAVAEAPGLPGVLPRRGEHRVRRERQSLLPLLRHLLRHDQRHPGHPGQRPGRGPHPLPRLLDHHRGRRELRERREARVKSGVWS